MKQSLVKGLAAVKHHSIKQKHFKPPSFPNLLTWAAKEQIRFLHRTNPEDWNMDNLVEHFPVTEEALKEILKRSRRIFQEKDILLHDMRVLENWNSLHAQIESGDVTEEDYKLYSKCFFNSQNECLVANAVCLPDTPCPKRVKKPKKIGPLSVIVEDCLKLQEKETQILLQEKIPSVTHQLSSKLEDMTLLFHKIASLQKKIRRNNSLSYFPDMGVGENKQSQFLDENRSFGTRSSVSIDIKPKNVSRGKPSLSGTYISSKSVYDENGEFLYKIP